MPEQYFLYQGGYHSLPDGEALPKGAVPVPRLPACGEQWDAKAKAFRTDAAIAADMEVPANHKERAHLLKALEASVILSGFTLTHGLIAEEARALGISTIDLARIVAERAEEFRAREVQRRVNKTS